MDIKSLFLKLRYRIKKILNYPKDNIKFFFQKKFTKIYFLSDNAGWAADRTTNSIFEMTMASSLNCEKTINHPKNQYVFYGDQYSLFAKNIFKYNNVISFDYEHGLPKYSESNKLLLNLVIKNQDKIKLIRVTNSFFKNFLIKSGIKEEKIFQIPLTVNDIFQKYDEEKCKEFRNEFNLPQNSFIVGSFHKDGDGFGEGMKPKFIKGPDIFLETLKILKKNINNLFVLLTAPARGYVKQGLDNLGIEYKHFKNLKFEELPKLYNCLDTYLISSRDEGGPTGMFEAMASGVPVVTTKVGHAFDSIKNGKNGFSVDVDDYQKLAESVEEIYKNIDLKKKFITESLIEASKQKKDKHKLLWMSFFNKLKKSD